MKKYFVNFIKGELNPFINLLTFFVIYLILILLTLNLSNFIEFQYLISLFIIFLLTFMYVSFKSMLFALNNEKKNIFYKISSVVIFIILIISFVITLKDLGLLNA